MENISFFEENKEVIIGGSFAIIGVVTGWILNLIQSYFQNKRDEKIYLKRKREDAYLRAIYSCVLIATDEKFRVKGYPSNEIISKVNEIMSFMKLYASSKIYIKYLEINNMFKDKKPVEQDNLDELSDLIRSELEITD